MAMEECKLADALDLSKDLRLGIGIGCAVIATAATFGGGAAASGASAGARAAIDAAKAGGTVVEATGMAAEAGATVMAASYQHTLDLLGIDAQRAQSQARQTAAQVHQEIQLLADLTESYEKCQGVLVDALAIQHQSHTALLTGARA